MKKIYFILSMAMAFYGCSSNIPNSPSSDAGNNDIQPKTTIEQPSPYFSWEAKAFDKKDLSAFYGRLVLENGCMYIKGSDEFLYLSAFPNDVTHWNEQKQTLTVNNIDFTLGDVINGYWYHQPYSEKNPNPFIKQANPQCLQEGLGIAYLDTMVGKGAKPAQALQGQYFAYPFEDKGEPEVQPAGWTKLENKNGCLGLSDDDLTVFPSGVTHWNAEKQVLVIRGQEFKVGDWIFSNGYEQVTYDEKNPFEFAQIAQPHCLKNGMALRVLRTQISKPSAKEMRDLDKGMLNLP